MGNVSVKEMGNRHFGRVNWLGTYTLAQRETRRFVAVWTQTILAPLVTAGLFLTIFSLAVGPSRGEVNGVPYVAFLVPGLLMMTVIQNAFANSSSSIMIAKVQGNIVDTLMPPLSPMETVIGYLAGSVLRGLMVAVAISVVMTVALGVTVTHPIWALCFVILGSCFMGGLGIIAAIYAQKFDQMAAITNFVITPLSFLSGTFYSIDDLPVALQMFTKVNPVFYLIDGLRFGVLGQSDSNPALGLLVCAIVTAVVLFICWSWIKSGFRMKP